MKVTVLGCGEAYEPGGANSSVLVEADPPGDADAGARPWALMIDCGPTIPSAYWSLRRPADALDAILFTHGHLDHCLGLPTLIDRMADDGRRKPLIICCDRGLKGRLEELVHVAAWPKTAFDGVALEWRDLRETDRVGPFALATALTGHSVVNRALRLGLAGKSLAYSGDGFPTEESTALMAGADLVFQETYAVTGDPKDAWHSDLGKSLVAMRKAAPRRGVLYHLRADQKGPMAEALAAVDTGNVEVRIAKPWEIYQL